MSGILISVKTIMPERWYMGASKVRQKVIKKSLAEKAIVRPLSGTPAFPSLIKKVVALLAPSRFPRLGHKSIPAFTITRIGIPSLSVVVHPHCSDNQTRGRWENERLRTLRIILMTSKEEHKLSEKILADSKNVEDDSDYDSA